MSLRGVFFWPRTRIGADYSRLFLPEWVRADDGVDSTEARTSTSRTTDEEEGEYEQVEALQPVPVAS